MSRGDRTMQSLNYSYTESRGAPLGALIPARPQVNPDRVSYERQFASACGELSEALDSRAALLPSEGATREALLAQWRGEAARIERLELRARGLRWGVEGHPARPVLLQGSPCAESLRELPGALSALGELSARLSALLAQCGETPGAVAREKALLAGTASSLRRRSLSVGRCGAISDIRACKGCGEGRPGSGVLSVDNQTWCRARGCSVCAAHRGSAQARKVERALRKVRLTEGYGLYHITFTLRWDPTNEDSFSYDSMRLRLQGARRALRSAWDPFRVFGDKSETGLKQSVEKKKTVIDENGAEVVIKSRRVASGLFVKFEISDRGNIHAHGLYYGNFIVKEQVEGFMRRAYPGAGHIKIRRVATPEEFMRWRSKEATDADKRSVGKSIRELCKYVTKAPSPHDEAYITGARRWRLDPRAAAAWEAALYQQPVSSVYGAFRGLGMEAEDESEGYLNEKQKIAKDGTIACGCCGLVGQWEWEVRRSHVWVRDCERRGALAYPRSKARRKKRKRCTH